MAVGGMDGLVCTFLSAIALLSLCSIHIVIANVMYLQARY